MAVFIGKQELIKSNAESKIFICTQCGECCYIRENKNITKKEEDSFKNYLFRHYGIIYLADLSEITISLIPEEKDRLENEAKKRNLELAIKPKRAIYDKKEDRLIILDYFIDHDICPFFDIKSKNCTVYDIRPTICRSYPLTTTKSYGKCKYKKLDFMAYDKELTQAKNSEDLIKRQKELIKKMISSEEIIIPKTIDEKEMEHMIKTAKIVELRLDKK